MIRRRRSVVAARPATALRVVVAGVLAVAGVPGLLGTPGAAAQARQQPCDGVVVVVDFGPLGDSSDPRIRCAAGDPASGLAALQAAGFGYTFVPRQAGLVCQIDAVPDPCNLAPVEARWAYWFAEPGGTWTYSTVGAGVRDPAPGTVEGWSFGAGQQPVIGPPVIEPPSGTSGPAGPSSGGSATGPAGSTATEPGGGVPLGLLGGVGLVAGIGAVGLWTARRRSRPADPAPDGDR